MAFAKGIVTQLVEITAKKLVRVVTLKYTNTGICCEEVFGGIQPPSEGASLIENCCRVNASCEEVTEYPYYVLEAGETEYELRPSIANSSQCIRNTVAELNSGPLEIIPPPDESWINGAMDRFENEIIAQEDLSPVVISECENAPSSPGNCTWGGWMVIDRTEIVKDTGQKKSKTYKGPDIQNYDFEHNCGDDTFYQ